jgi:uncharacterized protein (TIGR01777 family)
MSKTVLITGGSGLVGTRLTEILLECGYQVRHLGRRQTSQNSVKTYTWNIPSRFIEEGALENVNIVVHLAGAGVADQRWTKVRKKEILDSRVESTRLLLDRISTSKGQIDTVIAASAVGIYGSDTGDAWMEETTPAGEGFLAEVTESWENEIARFVELNLRVVTLRIGIVLSARGGALPKIAQPLKMGAGAAIGSGKQYMSWIHIDDLCRMVIQSIESVDINRVFNAVAPAPVTNKEFTAQLASILEKPLWLPNVPAFVLKAAMGEMSQIVLGGNRVSSKKIEATGFEFEYRDLRSALQAIYNTESGNK